jgi:hypothetical protein
MSAFAQIAPVVPHRVAAAKGGMCRVEKVYPKPAREQRRDRFRTVDCLLGVGLNANSVRQAKFLAVAIGPACLIQLDAGAQFRGIFCLGQIQGLVLPANGLFEIPALGIGRRQGAQIARILPAR